MKSAGLPFAKGHGTGNDFVIVPDPDGELTLTAPMVAALCDRRTGIGGDGLLRVVRTAAAAEVATAASAAPWFMDYRNADGSLAEMCGNGVRVFARYLIESGLAEGPQLSVLTRAGQVEVSVDGDVVGVQMPLPQLHGPAQVRLGGAESDLLTGTKASCGNPHLVVRVRDLDVIDLSGPPQLDAAHFPDGGNVEFITTEPGAPAPPGGGTADISAPDRAAATTVRMRVFERGVGETRSCGSGACVVAAVVLAESGRRAGRVAVSVPGGQLTVSINSSTCILSGPAVIVAVGRLVASLPGAPAIVASRSG
jgi:diaminopimelate epimerase